MELTVNNLKHGDKIWACIIELNDGKISLNRNTKPKLLDVHLFVPSNKMYKPYFIFFDEKWKEVSPYWTKQFSKYFYMFDNEKEAIEKYNQLVDETIDKIENTARLYILKKDEIVKKLKKI